MGQHIARHEFLDTGELAIPITTFTTYGKAIKTLGFSTLGVWITLPALLQNPPIGAYVEFYYEEQWNPGKVWWRRYWVSDGPGATSQVDYKRWRIRAPWTQRYVNIQIPINSKYGRLVWDSSWNPHQSLTVRYMLMSE